MVRNAGGRAFDAIRTLSVLQTIGAPGTIVVMHHTGKFVSKLESGNVPTELIRSRLRNDPFSRRRHQKSACGNRTTRENFN